MKEGFLIYWNNMKNGHQKFRSVKTKEKALKFKKNLELQGRHLCIWVTKFKDI